MRRDGPLAPVYGLALLNMIGLGSWRLVRAYINRKQPGTNHTRWQKPENGE